MQGKIIWEINDGANNLTHWFLWKDIMEEGREETKVGGKEGRLEEET